MLDIGGEGSEDLLSRSSMHTGEWEGAKYEHIKQTTPWAYTYSYHHDLSGQCSWSTWTSDGVTQRKRQTLYCFRVCCKEEAAQLSFIEIAGCVIMRTAWSPLRIIKPDKSCVTYPDSIPLHTTDHSMCFQKQNWILQQNKTTKRSNVCASMRSHFGGPFTYMSHTCPTCAQRGRYACSFSSLHHTCLKWLGEHSSF